MTTSTESETVMTDTVILEHPNLDGKRATVRARAVDAWARAGWHPVQAADDDTSAAPHHFLVLASSAAEAKDWARANDVPQADYTYASTADVVAGTPIAGLEVVELPTFAGHRHEAEIRAAVTTAFTPTTQPDPAGA